METAKETIYEIGRRIDGQPEPVFRGQRARMTHSAFLEAFTYTHPVVPGLIFAPVVAWAIWNGWQALGLLLPVAMAAGLFMWSLLEYLLHRFFFHLPRQGRVKTTLYLTFHGVHHMYPDDGLRLVMVPVVSIPLALFFWTLYGLALPAAWVPGTFAGLTLGYLNYDYSHWATHFLKTPKSLALRPLAAILNGQRRRHQKHHFGDHDKGFGVSTGLWDHVFGTVDPSLRGGR